MQELPSDQQREIQPATIDHIDLGFPVHTAKADTQHYYGALLHTTKMSFYSRKSMDFPLQPQPRPVMTIDTETQPLFAIFFINVMAFAIERGGLCTGVYFCPYAQIARVYDGHLRPADNLPGSCRYNYRDSQTQQQQTPK